MIFVITSNYFHVLSVEFLFLVGAVICHHPFLFCKQSLNQEVGVGECLVWRMLIFHLFDSHSGANA